MIGVFLGNDARSGVGLETLLARLNESIWYLKLEERCKRIVVAKCTFNLNHGINVSDLEFRSLPFLSLLSV